ncbi:ABC transporter permease [Caproiciproducens galactitolivorans]|uniref:ABC transporter permease subunit n=1 Tax=Caproiciproducens galactitolivorans TaxID=642589 RepID=A0ABT4BUH2_9FIRM|nr:ABC transporter permease subunit [Caproiciproducens galactitolivorans]MCY1714546.1 ABC transporter permease subunit [Caproiciproducens galactitolivorans]
MKLLTLPEQAVVKKDFGEIWSTKMVRNTMILVPVIMAVFLPILYLVLICFVPSNQINGADQMMKLLPKEAAGFNAQQSMFYLMTNMICPMFFLMIPLMSSSVSAACSFVGEKERSTIETLLLTPLSVKSIFKAKVLGCILLSAITTAISFVAFAIVISVGDIILQMPFFLNWNWLILVLLLAPAITVFGVVFMVLVSGRSKSYMESIQTSGYIVLPLILLFVGQFTGLFQLSALLLLFAAAVVVVADFLLWLFASRLFTPEKLLK